MATRSALGVIVLAVACGRPPAAVPEPSPRVVATAPEPATPPSCISPKVERELACPAHASGPVASVPPVTFPNGDALFHAGFDAPWARPLDPEILKAAVGRTKSGSASSTAASTALDSADGLFDLAAAPDVQGEADPAQKKKWRAAAAAFASFLKTNPGHEWSRYARHREVRALWNAGDVDEALVELLALLQDLGSQPQGPGARELEAIARADLPTLFAESTRKPSDIGALLGSVARDADERLRLREAIGEAYLAFGKYDESRTVLGELEASHPGAAACVYAARQLAVSIVRNPADRSGLMQQVKRVLGLSDLVARSSADDTDKERCRSATLAPVVELATAWHIGAVGWKDQLGTKDVSFANAAAELYAALREHFTVAELAKTPLPGVPASNRPSALRAGVAVAELRRWAHRFDECAQAYEGLEDLAQNASDRAAIVGGAVQCRMRQLRGLGWPDRDRPWTGYEAPLIADTLKELPALATQYVCLLEPAATDPLGTSEHLDVALARGRIPFLERRWEAAAAALEDLASVPGQPQAREAAAMYAISLHQLRESGRAVCGEELDRAKVRLARLHCSVPVKDPSFVRLALQNVTTREASTALTPCEALLAVGDPPAPVPPPPPPPPRPSPPQTPLVRMSGGLGRVGGNTPEVIGWTLGLHAPELRACYAAALRRDPYFVPTGGTVGLSLVIGRDGSVDQADIDFRGFANGGLTHCMRRVLYRTVFHQPEGGVPKIRFRAHSSLEGGLDLERVPSVVHMR